MESELRKKSVIGRFSTDSIISFWKECVEQLSGHNIDSIIKPLPKDFIGSKFGHDSIRIEGGKYFIFYVLSQHLNLFLEKYENNPRYELQVFMNKLNPEYVAKPLNDSGEHFVLYLRIVEKDIEVLNL